MKTRNCKITIWQCILSLLWSVPILLFGIYFIIYILAYKIEWWFVIPIILFFWIFLGIYPIYVFYIYYKHDKKVYMTINSSVERIFVEYKYVDDNIKVFEVTDIINVDSYHRFIIPLWYYEITINNGERILVSSLLSNTSYLFCKLKVNTFDGMNLIPFEWGKRVKRY